MITECITRNFYGPRQLRSRLTLQWLAEYDMNDSQRDELRYVTKGLGLTLFNIAKYVAILNRVRTKPFLWYQLRLCRIFASILAIHVTFALAMRRHARHHLLAAFLCSLSFGTELQPWKLRLAYRLISACTPRRPRLYTLLTMMKLWRTQREWRLQPMIDPVQVQGKRWLSSNASQLLWSSERTVNWRLAIGLSLQLAGESWGELTYIRPTIWWKPVIQFAFSWYAPSRTRQEWCLVGVTIIENQVWSSW